MMTPENACEVAAMTVGLGKNHLTMKLKVKSLGQLTDAFFSELFC